MSHDPQNQPDLPRKLYVELTTHCNLDCGMCMRHAWGEPGGSMTAETFARVLAQSAELPSIETLNFSGYGESLTHPRSFDFLAQAKARGLRTELVSNGLLLDPPAIEQILALRLDKLIVSVDGAGASDGQLHTGFAQVSAALKLLYHQKMARNLSVPEVWLEFVATRKNVRELLPLKALSRVLGFSGILVTNLIPHTRELAGETLYERWNTFARQNPQPSPYDPCIDFPLLDPRSQGTEAFDRLRAAGTHLRINGLDVFGSPPKCPFVAQGRLAVRWDGSLSPCLPLLHTHTYFPRGSSKHVASYSVGNVNETVLKQIWASEEYRGLRERVRNFDFSPCLTCSGCEQRLSNRQDCTGDIFPRCGECPWALGLVQCP
ncbi:MAG TPA: SPASM domain-containing protein [Planctomycetota bacterium]|jgi:MoaA/NifB/PqqE/SkfB family radical SAM enzyme